MPPNDLSVWVHDLDPYAIELWEGGPIRWYSLAYVAGFIIGFFLIRRVMRRGASPLAASTAGDLVAALAIGAVVGARFGYVLFYQPSLLWTFDSDFPFWKALAIHEGGMASHGGMIGVVLAALFFARRHRVPFLHILDLAAFAAPLGLFLGRIANFVNGELYGRPAPPALPWAMKFPSELFTWPADRLARVQSQLASLLDPADVAARGFAGAAVHAVQSGDGAFAAALAPYLTARHPSQLYEALLEGVVVFVVLLIAWRVPRRAGTIAALFGVVYAIVRVIGEQYRMPDAHILSLEFTHFGVTRGQLLSIALLIASAVVLLYSRRLPKLGGWRRALMST